MTTDIITILKSTAKRFARKQRIGHTDALEIVAREVGKPNWRVLAEAHKQGWKPDPATMERLSCFLSGYATPGSLGMKQDNDLSFFGHNLIFTRWTPDNVEPMEADEIHGELDGHKFYLAGDEFNVAFGSQGWEIEVDQAPSSKPKLRRLGGRVKSPEALDPDFIERASKLLMIRARRMHAEVAAEWPRRSTKPDAAGRVLHPLDRRGLSAKWHCLHCDGAHDGHVIASNLWHCPDCGATPLDMFPEPFWNEPFPPSSN